MDNRAPLAPELALELARVERDAIMRVVTRLRAQYQGLDYPTERERRHIARNRKAA